MDFRCVKRLKDILFYLFRDSHACIPYADRCIAFSIFFLYLSLDGKCSTIWHCLDCVIEHIDECLPDKHRVKGGRGHFHRDQGIYPYIFLAEGIFVKEEQFFYYFIQMNGLKHRFYLFSKTEKVVEKLFQPIYLFYDKVCVHLKRRALFCLSIDKPGKTADRHQRIPQFMCYGRRHLTDERKLLCFYEFLLQPLHLCHIFRNKDNAQIFRTVHDRLEVGKDSLIAGFKLGCIGFYLALTHVFNELNGLLVTLERMAILEVSAEQLLPLHIEYLLSRLVHKGSLIFLIRKDNSISYTTQHRLEAAFAINELEGSLRNHRFEFMGIFPELLLGPRPFSDILAYTYSPNLSSVFVPEQGKGKADINNPSTFSHKPGFIVGYHTLAFNHIEEFAPLLSLIIIISHAGPNDLAHLVSQDPLCPFIKCNDSAIKISCNNRITRISHDTFQIILCLFQFRCPVLYPLFKVIVKPFKGIAHPVKDIRQGFEFIACSDIYLVIKIPFPDPVYPFVEERYRLYEKPVRYKETQNRDYQDHCRLKQEYSEDNPVDRGKGLFRILAHKGIPFMAIKIFWTKGIHKLYRTKADD